MNCHLNVFNDALLVLAIQALRPGVCVFVYKHCPIIYPQPLKFQATFTLMATFFPDESIISFFSFCPNEIQLQYLISFLE